MIKHKVIILTSILYFLLQNFAFCQAELSVYDFNNNEINFKSLNKKNRLSVYIFYSTDCPMCQLYLADLKRIDSILNIKNSKLYLIFPSIYEKDEIDSLLNISKVNFNYYFDNDYHLARDLKAKVTPEVFVFNSISEIIYQGAIDNRLDSLGHKRVKATKFYLNDLLISFFENKPLKVKKTLAVGCFLEYD